jgi:hypothetical protein
VRVEYRDLDESLLKLAASSPKAVLLAAPFVKRSVVESIVSRFDTALTTFDLITRWRPDEIQAGVSDVDVYEVVAGLGGSVYLLDNLHAKYYRFGQRCLLGSANLTRAGMGFATDSNLEILVETEFDASSAVFEAELFTQSTHVDEATYEAFKDLQALLRTALVDDSQTPKLDLVHYLSRNPAELWEAYLDVDMSGENVTARSDQQFLDLIGIPPGVTCQKTFNQVVRVALSANSVVRRWNVGLSEEPQRFGSLTRLLGDETETTHQAAKLLTQALIRNLIYFFPDRYRLSRPNFTEVLEYRK